MATTESGERPAAPGPPQDPAEILRSRGYLAVLVVGAVIGAPIALVAYWFLQLTAHLQGWLFVDLPKALDLGSPTWWPIPVLVTGGLLVALTIKYLPGRGGHSPAEGFHAGGPPAAVDLPGIALAAARDPRVRRGPRSRGPADRARRWAGRLVGAPAQARRSHPGGGPDRGGGQLRGDQHAARVSAPAAFLLMELAGIGGAMTSLMLVPGLLAAGIGSLVFIGLDSLTGLGTTSLVIADLPHVGAPTVGEFGWAIAIGVAAAVLGTTIRALGIACGRGGAPAARGDTGPGAAGRPARGPLHLDHRQARVRRALLRPGHDRDADHAECRLLGPTLLLLVLCKGTAYGLSLGGFRGGPIFPAMFLGAAGGVALSHLPGLDLVAGAAMGIGAMCVVMLGYPLVSVMLPTLLLLSDGLDVIPLVIVAVVVAYVGRAWLDPSNGRVRLFPRGAQSAG